MTQLFTQTVVDLAHTTSDYHARATGTVVGNAITQHLNDMGSSPAMLDGVNLNIKFSVDKQSGSKVLILIHKVGE